MTAALRSQRLRAAAEAALILAVGMGFGRFAFTALLPHLIGEGLLDLRQGSAAATANYAGYLLGAFVVVRARAVGAHRLCLWSVIGTAACLAVLALPMPVWTFVAIRGLAGVFSALAMVAASLWLLEHRAHAGGAPLLYGGVGLGIAVSAELLVAAAHAGMHSAGMWLMLAAASLVVGIVAAPGLVASVGQPRLGGAAPAAAEAPALAHRPLVIAYGLAGFGYIVTATYLPTLVRAALPHLDAAHVWAVFGIGAVPSCFLWHRLHERLGTRQALCLNLLAQAVGVALPALLPSAGGYLISALLVGGTFLGTATIAMPAAQRVARETGRNLLATMTLLYGAGQIAGPVLAEAVRAHGGTFTDALLAAAGALLIAALVSLRL